MIIFLDANIIIYQVEAVFSFRDKVHGVISDISTREPDSRFAVSRLSLLECLVKLTTGNGMCRSSHGIVPFSPPPI